MKNFTSWCFSIAMLFNFASYAVVDDFTPREQADILRRFKEYGVGRLKTSEQRWLRSAVQSHGRRFFSSSNEKEYRALLSWQNLNFDSRDRGIIVKRFEACSKRCDSSARTKSKVTSRHVDPSE